jgi:hypothetical protein
MMPLEELPTMTSASRSSEAYTPSPSEGTSRVAGRAFASAVHRSTIAWWAVSAPGWLMIASPSTAASAAASSSTWRAVSACSRVAG